MIVVTIVTVVTVVTVETVVTAVTVVTVVIIVTVVIRKLFFSFFFKLFFSIKKNHQKTPTQMMKLKNSNGDETQKLKLLSN